MIDIFKTLNNNEMIRTRDFEEGIWINLTNPTEDEINRVSNKLSIEKDFLKAALDEEERARIEYENGQLLILVDIPIIEKEGKLNVYTTIPLGIILIKHCIITVCLKDDTLLDDFINSKVKSFVTDEVNK
jgi:magnesium transporter